MFPLARVRPRASDLAVCLLLAASAACEQAALENVITTAAVPVVVEPARVERLQGIIAVTGVIAPAPGAESVVVAPAPGRIAELPRSEGDPVRPGDVLVRFDIPSLRADVAAGRAAMAQASARGEAASATLVRLSSLLTQGVAAVREVEDARRQVAEAEADLAQAQQAVEAAVALSDRMVVRATFSGVVTKRFHNVGDFVDASAGDPVLRVVDPTRVQVIASVPASELSRVIVGHAANIRQAGSDRVETASVLFKSPQIDPASGTVEVRLGLSPRSSLAAGLTVLVEIVSEDRPQALVVPVAALVTDEAGTYVMVVGADDVAHKHPVVVGLTTLVTAEILSGLQVGHRVIVRGQDGLPDGATVTVATI